VLVVELEKKRALRTREAN